MKKKNWIQIGERVLGIWRGMLNFRKMGECGIWFFFFFKFSYWISLNVLVRTRFVTTHNNVGFARKNAQTISLIEHGFKRLGLGHWTVVRVGSGQRISSEESGELYALIILLISRTPWLGGRVVPPLPPSLTLPLLSFYTGIYPLTSVHV